jgi:hypothetical protein
MRVSRRWGGRVRAVQSVKDRNVEEVAPNLTAAIESTKPTTFQARRAQRGRAP